MVCLCLKMLDIALSVTKLSLTLTWLGPLFAAKLWQLHFDSANSRDFAAIGLVLCSYQNQGNNIPTFHIVVLAGIASNTRWSAVFQILRPSTLVHVEG